MDKLRITGGNRLSGSIPVGGAKNAALPEMAAALLSTRPVVLENVPLVRDIETTGRLLAELGAEVQVSEDHTARVDARSLTSCQAPYELVRTMRASVLVLGPLLARMGRARVSLPGGCAIGARPIDFHLRGLQKMGAEIRTDHGYVEARARRLHGAEVHFDRVTVTGTANLLMAATLADGETVLRNAACEPEIVDLARLLTAMGAEIGGAGSSEIVIRGVEALGGARHRVMPDRIEAGTFLIAGAISGGDLEIGGADASTLGSTIEKLRQTGVRIETAGERIHVTGVEAPRAADVSTHEYPGFPTDMQAQYMAFATQACGTSVVTENIFENRFMHASELVRMGARIRIEGPRAVVEGPSRLTGANLIASDLRASASLVLAALVAEGETLIDRVYHLDRGYERIEERLRPVGAQIERVR
jgi:UDP-N-acetylglucosamine 1-carboxyvinyltransferase